ncbi:MAG: antibiotic biosynthesis monooxygenase [Clostridia bacterium]|nr:antibiotic biosynthesis monooxygenase [Clostridia bacterium]
MIVLNVTYKCKTGLRKEFLEAIRREGIDEASRAEAGNLRYDYYLPYDDNGDLLLVEKWKDADAVRSHGQTAHLKRLSELKKLYVTETIIERFEA